MSKKGIGRGLGRRQLALEQLERRELLAGQVTVTKSGEDLKIVGDKSSNQIAVFWVADDTFAVVGIGTDIKGNNPTSGGFEYKVVSGIKNIKIDLKNGNDLVSIGNDAEDLVKFGVQEGVISSGSASAVQSALESFLGSAAYAEFQLDKELNIRTGEGNDGVVILDANIGQRIDADLGNGNNDLLIDPTIVGDDIILRAGKGNDNFAIDDTEIAQMLDVNLGDGENELDVKDSEVGESADITTGKGNDNVEFYNTDIDLNFIVRTGGGDDYVEYSGGGEGGHAVIGQTADINTGAGNDEVEICAADIGIKSGGEEIGWSLKINTEDGIDLVFVGCEGTFDTAQIGGDVEVGDDLLINLGSGNDGNNPSGPDGGAFVENVAIVDNFEVHGGSGHDFIEAQFLGIGHDAFINGNDGDDEVYFYNFGIANNLSIDLSTGNDYGEVYFGETGGDLNVNLGDGEDEFYLYLQNVGKNLNFDAGAKTDYVEIGFLSADNIFINMGDGQEDFLGLYSVSSNNDFKVDGGSGNDDTLEDDSGDTVNDVNFEIFTP